MTWIVLKAPLNANQPVQLCDEQSTLCKVNKTCVKILVTMTTSHPRHFVNWLKTCHKIMLRCLKFLKVMFVLGQFLKTVFVNWAPRSSPCVLKLVICSRDWRVSGRFLVKMSKLVHHICITWFESVYNIIICSLFMLDE